LKACTKGIWACIAKDQNEKVIMFLDNEGLYDVDSIKGSEYDVRILNFMKKLCHVFIFNIKGSFDTSHARALM